MGFYLTRECIAVICHLNSQVAAAEAAQLETPSPLQRPPAPARTLPQPQPRDVSPDPTEAARDVSPEQQPSSSAVSPARHFVRYTHPTVENALLVHSQDSFFQADAEGPRV